MTALYRALYIIAASIWISGVARESLAQGAAISEIAVIERATARYFRTKYPPGTIITLDSTGLSNLGGLSHSPGDILALAVELGAPSIEPPYLAACDGETRTNCFDFMVTFEAIRISGDSAVVEVRTRFKNRSLTLHRVTLALGRNPQSWEVVQYKEVSHAILRAFEPP